MLPPSLNPPADPTVCFVPAKFVDHQDMRAVHRVREFGASTYSTD